MTDLAYSEFERILIEDKHVVDFIPGEKWDVPEIDFTLFSRPDDARNVIDVFVEYLNSYYIIDDFKHDHRARREWRKEIELKHPGFSKLYQNNALKIGGQLPAYNLNTEQLFGMYQGDKKALARPAAELIIVCNQCMENWEKQSPTDQVEYCKLIKNEMYKLITFLSDQ